MAVTPQYKSNRTRGRRTRRSLHSDINVTPMVDLFLVLLLVFIMTASNLLPTVPLDLPKTDAESETLQQDPVTVSIQLDGSIFLNGEAISLDALPDALAASSPKGFEEPIYLQGDGEADYQDVVEVMSRINTAGYQNLRLVTDSIRDE